jgi:hypothetical protein
LRLANASGTTPRVRDFHPLEKLHLLKALFNQKYLYFCNFLLALQQVRTAHAGRTQHLPKRRGFVFQRQFGGKSSISFSNQVLW